MKIAIEGTSLRNRLSDSGLEHLMIAIEGTSLRNRLSDSGLEHLIVYNNRLSDSAWSIDEELVYVTASQTQAWST